MSENEQPSLRERNRRTAQDAVLDAAERLLRDSETADFSMRALATEAGVGFATPFNHFGSKTAIMQALSSRLIARMKARFEKTRVRGDAIDRVLAMGRIGVDVLLEQPDVSKRVVGSLGVVSNAPHSVSGQSAALWTMALGDLKGITATQQKTAMAILPMNLAFLFRGCVSFWIAGEISDRELSDAFQTVASVSLLGFARPERRAQTLLALGDRDGLAIRRV